VHAGAVAAKIPPKKHQLSLVEMFIPVILELDNDKILTTFAIYDIK